MAGFDDSYNNEELISFMLMQEESVMKTSSNIKYELKNSFYDESRSKIDHTVDFKPVKYLEPSDEEIIKHFKCL